jgi:hypothetical protein
MINAGDYDTVTYEFPEHWRVDTPDIPGRAGRGVAIFRKRMAWGDGEEPETIEEDSDYVLGATPAAVAAIGEGLGVSFSEVAYPDYHQASWAFTRWENNDAQGSFDEVTLHMYGYTPMQERAIRNAIEA